MDLERLDEALAGWNDPEAHPLENVDGMVAILNAAMAYRDLLANGERVEPDYEAAAEQLYDGFIAWLPDDNRWKWSTNETAKRRAREGVRRIVDAAIGEKLLVSGGEWAWYCETHGEVNVEQWCPGGPVAAALNQFGDVAEMSSCRIVSKLLVDYPTEEE